MVCSMCDIDKEETAFYTRRTAHGPVLRAHCKACHVAGTVAYQKRERQSHLESMRKYYYRNREAKLAYQRDYERRKREAQRELCDMRSG